MKEQSLLPWWLKIVRKVKMMWENWQKTYREMRRYYDAYQGQWVRFLQEAILGVLPLTLILSIFLGVRAGLSLGLLAAIFNFIRKLQENKPVHSQFFPEARAPLAYNLVVTFYTLGYLAKAKGRVAANDIHYAEYLMRQFQVDEPSRQSLIQVFNQGKNGAYPFAAVLAEFARVFHSRPQVLSYFFDYQLIAAMQDGQLQDPELNVLREIAAQIGMSQFSFEQKIFAAGASYQFRHQGGFYSNREQEGQSNHHYGQGGTTAAGSVTNAYAILGVTKSDTQEVVKKAYRRLIQQYHPDKFSAKEVPQAVLDEAQQKSQEIISAYDLICRYKGWKK